MDVRMDGRVAVITGASTGLGLAMAKEFGFKNVASGPLVRSSSHADKQAAGEEVF